MVAKKLDPVHPGEILQKEFLEPMSLSQNRLAIAVSLAEIVWQQDVLYRLLKPFRILRQNARSADFQLYPSHVTTLTKSP
jgi:hypothetical protein